MEINPIDKLFKDKLSSEEVEFNPAAWSAAEGIIAQQSVKTVWYTGKAFLSVLFASILTIIGAIWFLSHKSSASENNIASTSTNEVKAITINNTINNSAIPISSKISKTLVIQESDENSDLTAVIKRSDLSNESFSSVNTNNHSSNQEQDKIAAANNSAKSENDVTNTVSSALASENSTTRKRSSSATFEMSFREKDIDDVDLLATGELQSEEDFSQPIELPINDKGLSIIRNVDFRLIFGGGAAWGFRNPQLADPSGLGYSPTAGFSVGYIANSEFSFDVNVLYRMRTGLSKEALILPTSKSDATVAQSIHYLDVPFYLNYHSDRHSVQFGMQYSYLISTRLETTNSTDNSSTIGWGKNDYFKNSDLAALIGYKFMLNEQLNIGARFNYGIFDVTSNQPSAWETNDKNLHLNFLLEYKLSKY